MSQSERDRDSDLSGAIRRLETLLDSQPGNGEGEDLPVLDEVVDPDAADELAGAFDLGEATTPPRRPDPERVRALLERLGEHIDAEVDRAAEATKRSIIETCRRQLAEEFDLDPRELGPRDAGDHGA